MRQDVRIWRKGRFPYKMIVSDLLEDIISDASANAVRFIQNAGYTTFLYGERQMNSILAPAFHKHTDAMVMEYPSTRKIGASNHQARADYFCYCNTGQEKEYRLFVELKSSCQKLPLSNGFYKANIELYQDACSQIKGLINEVRGKNKAFYSGTPIIRVSMISIALYTTGTDENIDVDYDDVINKATREFTYDSQDMDCNFIALWKTNKWLKNDIKKEWEEDNYTFHGILYICHIMESITV